jgi:methylated-DNA-[protein]-cysteine S-methyltransferase
MNKDTEHSWTSYESPFGTLTLTAGTGGLDGLFFPGRAPALDEDRRDPEGFVQATGQLDEYFGCARGQFDLALDLSAGTPFQQAVWRELEAIPFGETVSYTELAARLGRTDRVRAVGAANGRNPLPIIVPCHRVIGADGSLTGYRGGLPLKQALLDFEQAATESPGTAVAFGSRQLALL